MQQSNLCDDPNQCSQMSVAPIHDAQCYSSLEMCCALEMDTVQEVKTLAGLDWIIRDNEVPITDQ